MQPGCAGSRSDASIDTFFARAEAVDGRRWLDEEAKGYVAPLPRPTRIQLAERALSHSDPAVRLYGVELLYQLQLDDRADQAAAQLIARGDDLTALGWAWMHSGEPDLLQRRLDGIRSALTAQLPTMTPDERERAAKFLCDGEASCPHRK
jgi:hypothetical protein